jgi:hypothetical protein
MPLITRGSGKKCAKRVVFMLRVRAHTQVNSRAHACLQVSALLLITREEQGLCRQNVTACGR